MAYDSPNTCKYSYSPEEGMCAKSSPQVETEFKELTGAIETLDASLSRLGDRIMPVVRESSACPQGISAPERELVPLANELRRNRQKIEGLSERIQSWLNRIEL